MVTKNPDRVDIEALMDDGTLIDRALEDAARAARLEHRRSGDPIVVWQNGQAVWVRPDEIELNGPQSPESTAL